MAKQFLEVIDAERAQREFRAALKLSPPEIESVNLSVALGRVLAQDVVATVDVPGFDRSNVDGYALRAADTFGAEEAAPKVLALNDEELSPGIAPKTEVTEGRATYVATGGMIPRGADAVVMIEYCEPRADEATGERVLEVRKASVPGALVSFAGSDIARGEAVVRHGTRLTARETGTIAAVGLADVSVFRKPRVAVFSTGDEIVAPGEAMRPGLIYDSNLRILCDTLRELGCKPVDLGVVRDDPDALRERVQEGLAHDALVFSGGTSKGEGDHSVPALEGLAEVICHGVAVKPGKPICLASADGKPVVVLPGFPTSAVFTFHEFLAPVLRELTGAPADVRGKMQARLPVRLHSERGRTEFVLVGLVAAAGEAAAGDDSGEWVAYPMGKGSGSVTTFARADGFVVVDRQQEIVEANETVVVHLLGREVRPADLVVIGSHCVGLDYLLSRLAERGYTAKSIAVGSQAGLLAAERGECDVAGVHLCDKDGVYNEPFLPGGVTLERGYGRMQGIVSRDEEPDLERDRMVNRNRGSGTRVLLDELLDGARPPGFAYEARSHNAVAAAVSQGRADWGVAIEPVARLYGLHCKPLRREHFDFAIPKSRRDRPVVQAFSALLTEPEVRAHLASLGLE